MKTLLLALTAVLLLGGCNQKRKQPNIELIQDMMVSPSVKAQDEDPNSMKYPPEGTLAQGVKPYTLQTFEEASAQLVNPFEKSKESILAGQKVYQTYCFVCHGATGDGKGPVTEKWPSPVPNMLTKRARDYKDGYFYHIVTKGRGLMGSYAYQVKPEDRWHLINYIRHMQSNSPVLDDQGNVAQ